MFKLQRA